MWDTPINSAAALEPTMGSLLPTFQDLFMIEREFKELDPDERLTIRQERSAPLVDGIYTFIEELGPSLRPTSLLSKACVRNDNYSYPSATTTFPHAG